MAHGHAEFCGEKRRRKKEVNLNYSDIVFLWAGGGGGEEEEEGGSGGDDKVGLWNGELL